jgi:lipopolysaccharide export LptBFGC system permease protein LptF
MRWMNQIKSILIVIVIQFFFAALTFVGFLLDPLIGVWVVAIYFFGIGSFLMYCYVERQLRLPIDSEG